MKIKLSIFVVLASIAFANAATAQHFDVLPLGTHGGALETNLSSYLVSPIVSNKPREWVALDGGTYCSQLQKTKFNDPVQAYLISHAHLDHISGLAICSVGDSNTQKEILARDSTIDDLRDDIFNWEIWPNFGDEGDEPLKVYHYHRLKLEKEVQIPNTMMTVKAFPLSHGNGGYPSTAFLIQANGFYLLYFGDTGPDRVEKSHDIEQIWKAVAPLIRKNKLSAIFIEASYPNGRPNNLLFGHLTPAWLLDELNELASEVDSKNPRSALSQVKVVVTHIKQGLTAADNNIEDKILKELNEGKKDLNVEFIIPKQGQRMTF